MKKSRIIGCLLLSGIILFGTSKLDISIKHNEVIAEEESNLRYTDKRTVGTMTLYKFEDTKDNKIIYVIRNNEFQKYYVGISTVDKDK